MSKVTVVEGLVLEESHQENPLVVVGRFQGSFLGDFDTVVEGIGRNNPLVERGIHTAAVVDNNPVEVVVLWHQEPF